MIIRAECTIDLDEKRRVWSEMSAELDPEDATADNLGRLAEAAAAGAIRAHEAAVERHPGLFPKQRDPLATFGDGKE